MSVFEKKLEITVQTEIIIVIIPADDMDTPKSTCIIGHAEPMSESGSPRLINDKYMIASSNEYIMPYRILSIGKTLLNFIAYSITSFFDFQ